MVMTAKAGPASNKELDHNPCLPRGWQGSNYRSHHRLPAAVCTSRCWGQEMDRDSKPGPPMWDAGDPKCPIGNRFTNDAHHWLAACLAPMLFPNLRDTEGLNVLFKTHGEWMEELGC